MNVAKEDVQAMRQRLRDQWVKAIREDWDNLAAWQQRHCLNPDNLQQWWPGTEQSPGELTTPA